MTPNDVKIVANNIDDFIEVPNGLVRLRKAVLTLAVSGKLVSQNLKEGTGEELFNKIKNNQIKKTKSHVFLTTKDIPFDIPKSWKWVRLGEIGHTETGSTPRQTGKRFEGGTIPFVRPDNIKNLLVSEVRDYLSESDIKNGGTLIPKGSLLMVCIGTIGKVGVVYQEVSFNQQINAILPHTGILPEYILYISASGYFQELAWKLSSKTTLPILNKSKWESIPIPIPPTNEQERIVKKVNEIMKQLDELEIKKRNQDETRTRLAQSAMQSLGKGESKIAFKNLTELIKTPGDIKELENALLTLAVSGKLVPQDKKEGTGEELYKKILEMKEKEVVKGKKKTKELKNISSSEIPFEIPKTWVWVRLGDVFTSYSSGSTPSRGNDIFYVAGNTNWYKSGELNDGILSSDSEEKITDSALDKCHLRLNKYGDLLIAMYGATAGRVAILENKGTTNQAVWGGTPIKNIEVKYLFFYILQSRHELLKTSSGAAQPNISGEKISMHILPLPPFEEQKRIVKKVEEIMVLINQLRDIVGGNKSQGRGRPKK